MAATSVGSITQVTMFGVANAQRIMNVFTFQNGAQWSQSTTESYYDKIRDLIKVTGPQDIITPYLACLSTGYTLEKYRVQSIYPVRYRGKDYTSGAAGTRIGDCDSQNVAASVTKQTELSGRSKIGRYQLGGLATGDYLLGFLTLGTMGRIATFNTALLQVITEGFGQGTMSLCVFHRKTPSNEPPDRVTALVTNGQVRTQRTRTIGKGE